MILPQVGARILVLVLHGEQLGPLGLHETLALRQVLFCLLTVGVKEVQPVLGLQLGGRRVAAILVKLHS